MITQGNAHGAVDQPHRAPKLTFGIIRWLSIWRLRAVRLDSRLVMFIAMLGLVWAAAIPLSQGLAVHLKARLAQFLIERAWQDNQATPGLRSKPWAWADTTPVARLSFPNQQRSLIVLSGDSGRVLAFGPGHRAGTALPGRGSNSVISGHRDTHFSLLAKLTPGDPITVQSLSGTMVHYVVDQLRIVDYRDISVTRDRGRDELTLVTCWPFNVVRAGGPDRYVVSARRVSY